MSDALGMLARRPTPCQADDGLRMVSLYRYRYRSPLSSDSARPFSQPRSPPRALAPMSIIRQPTLVSSQRSVVVPSILVLCPVVAEALVTSSGDYISPCTARLAGRRTCARTLRNPSRCDINTALPPLTERADRARDASWPRQTDAAQRRAGDTGRSEGSRRTSERGRRPTRSAAEGVGLHAGLSNLDSRQRGTRAAGIRGTHCRKASTISSPTRRRGTRTSLSRAHRAAHATLGRPATHCHTSFWRNVSRCGSWAVLHLGVHAPDATGRAYSRRHDSSGLSRVSTVLYARPI